MHTTYARPEFKDLQRRLLSGAFVPRRIETAIDRFGRMRDDSLDSLNSDSGYFSSLFIYTLTGAKPASTIYSKSIVGIARGLDMPVAELSFRAAVLIPEPWLIAHDIESYEAFMRAYESRDIKGVGTALGYPDPSASLLKQDIFTKVKEQRREGRTFQEPMLYIEPQCVHGLTEEALKAGRERKVSLLAFGCELRARGLSEYGLELARSVAGLNILKREYGPIPEPVLPDLETLAMTSVDR